jgi:hypothetical protein
MSRVISDEQSKKIIVGFYELIEVAIKAARANMSGVAGCQPARVNEMLALIQRQAERAQEYKWPDPAARLAQAASQNVALQKLLKRASKSTPIRATASHRADQARNSGGAS